MSDSVFSLDKMPLPNAPNCPLLGSKILMPASSVPIQMLPCSSSAISRMRLLVIVLGLVNGT